MKETFGVEFELILGKFKQKFENFKNEMKNGGEQIKNNLKVNADINTQPFNKLESDFELASQKADMLYNTYKNLKAELDAMPSWKVDTEEYQKLSDKVNRAELAFKTAGNRSDELRQKIEDLKLTSDMAGKSSNKLADRFDSSMNKMSSKVKKFGLSLLSVRSVYSLLSRASQAYMSIDTSASQKMQSAWAGIGAVLAPILERLSNLFIKLASYINVFVKALTGKDYIAIASAKAMDKMSKSAKDASKSLAGFDEVENLSNDTGGGAGITNPFDAFNDVELNSNVVTKLQEMAKWLKENWTWIKKVGIALGVWFGISKISGWLSNIGLLNGALGKTGLLGNLTSIATIGLITLTEVKQLKEDCQKIRENANKGNKEMIDNLEDINVLYDTMYARQLAGNQALIDSDYFINRFLGLSDELLENAKNTVILSEDIADELKRQSDNTKMTKDEQMKLLDEVNKQYATNEGIIKKLQEEGIETSKLEGIQRKYADLISETVKKLDDQGISQDEISKKLGISKDRITEILNITKEGATFKVCADTSQAETQLGKLKVQANNIFSGKEVQFKVNYYNPDKKASSIYPYDVGTNYVPNDQLAYIHKGEAVVPKQFNSQEFFGSGNEETNELLRDLIDRVDRIEVNPYTTVKDVGSASVDYINSQNRILGRSLIK